MLLLNLFLFILVHAFLYLQLRHPLSVLAGPDWLFKPALIAEFVTVGGATVTFTSVATVAKEQSKDLAIFN